MRGREREKTFERKVPFPAKQQMEGLPTEIAAEDRSLTETSAKKRGPTHCAAKSSVQAQNSLIKTPSPEKGVGVWHSAL